MSCCVHRDHYCVVVMCAREERSSVVWQATSVLKIGCVRSVMRVSVGVVAKGTVTCHVSLLSASEAFAAE